MVTFNIKERREKLGLSQHDIATYVGVSDGTVSRWENGAIGNMRRDKIDKLAKILAVSPVELIGHTDDGEFEIVHAETWKLIRVIDALPDDDRLRAMKVIEAMFPNEKDKD